jgi:uncharacterized protein
MIARGNAPTQDRLRFWALAACAVILLSALLPLMLRHIVNQFVYYPMRYPQGDWDLQAALGAEDVWLTTRDGVQLNAWWFPSAGSQIATLFLHGNAGNVTHRVDHAQAVKDAGSAILVIDYRGYGKSKGQPGEHGLYLDAAAGYEKLRRLGYSADRIILHGESLGTAVAVDLASRERCAGVILESPLASLSEMAGQVLPIIGPLLAHGFNTDKKIRRVHAPLLIIHGDADEVVPFSQGQAVFKAANEPKQFWQIPGAHHNDLLYVAGPSYVARVRAFYQTLSQEPRRAVSRSHWKP